MDQLKSEMEIPSALPLDGLCAGAHHELLMRGYSRRMVNRYMLVWQHLAEFAREHDLGNDYSRNLAMRFEEVYGLREGERLKPTEMAPISRVRSSNHRRLCAYWKHRAFHCREKR